MAHAPKILSSYGSSGFGASSGSHSGFGRARFGSFSLKGGPFGYKPDGSFNKSRSNSKSEPSSRKLSDLSPPTTQRQDSIDVYMTVSEKNKAETRSYPADIGYGRPRAASNGKEHMPRYAAAVYSDSRQNSDEFNRMAPLPPRPSIPSPSRPQRPVRGAGDWRSPEGVPLRPGNRGQAGARRMETTWSPVGGSDVVMV